MAQKGFEYEEQAYNALQQYNISTGGVAGSTANKPDLTIKIGNKTAGVELKNKPTAAGSLVLKYYDGSWHFGETGGKVEKEFLKEIGDSVNIIKKLNDQWKNPALRYTGANKTTKEYIGFSNQRAAYNSDLKKFGNMYIDVPNNVISKYYHSKKCGYFNVGSKGLFLLEQDTLNLNAKLRKLGLSPIPKFSDINSAKTQIRVRVQAKGGGDYQFVFTFQFKSVSNSPYNLAPLKSGSTYIVDKNILKKNPILRVF